MIWSCVGVEVNHLMINKKKYFVKQKVCAYQASQVHAYKSLEEKLRENIIIDTL
jgi:hypothetical protein